MVGVLEVLFFMREVCLVAVFIVRDGCRVLHRRGPLRPGCWFYGVVRGRLLRTREVRIASGRRLVSQLEVSVGGVAGSQLEVSVGGGCWESRFT